MEIDRQALTKLLEAFADTAEVLQRELMLYQLLFYGACRTKGLTDEETQKLVERGRTQSIERIRAKCHPEHQDLLAKLPQIIDLLASDQDAASKLLREWIPKGRPN